MWFLCKNNIGPITSFGKYSLLYFWKRLCRIGILLKYIHILMCLFVYYLKYLFFYFSFRFHQLLPRVFCSFVLGEFTFRSLMSWEINSLINVIYFFLSQRRFLVLKSTLSAFNTADAASFYLVSAQCIFRHHYLTVPLY